MIVGIKKSRAKHNIFFITYKVHCTENPIYVFPEMELPVLVPNSYIHVSGRDLYIPRIGLPICLQQNRQTDSQELKNRSQIHECRNRTLWGRTVAFLGIHKSEPDIYIGFSPALHLKCATGNNTFILLWQRCQWKKSRYSIWQKYKIFYLVLIEIGGLVKFEHF
jgi:hypothetical protein